ncbi:MAG: type II toxin-antitoxin system RelE/ParE family toxin [Roseovarius sp.]|nr:type II toxin-antitoxin system RelE/ParE family toxin [Roseovarius sp.]
MTEVRRSWKQDVFLSERSPGAARSAARAIRDGVWTVADHPEVGRPVEHMGPEFREWPISFGASGYVAL